MIGTSFSGITENSRGKLVYFQRLSASLSQMCTWWSLQTLEMAETHLPRCLPTGQAWFPNLQNQIRSSSSSKIGVQIGEPHLPLWFANRGQLTSVYGSYSRHSRLQPQPFRRTFQAGKLPTAPTLPTRDQSECGAGQKSWVGLHGWLRIMGF